MFPQDNHLRWDVPARGDMPAVHGQLLRPRLAGGRQGPGEEVRREVRRRHASTSATRGSCSPAPTATTRASCPRRSTRRSASRQKMLARSKHGVKGDFLAACQGRRAGQLELRLRRPVHRVRADRRAGQPGRRRQEARVGRGQAALHQRPGGRAVGEAHLPQGLGGVNGERGGLGVESVNGRPPPTTSNERRGAAGVSLFPCMRPLACVR